VPDMVPTGACAAAVAATKTTRHAPRSRFLMSTS